MTRTSKVAAFGCAFLCLGGCLPAVGMAPLPQNHPANPGAPSGVVRPVGQILIGSETDARDDVEEVHEAGHEQGRESKMKCGRDHGR